MYVYDGIHWNIYDILPYQRNFNLINGERSLGKTYTCQMFTLDKCIEKGFEFVYIVRTQDEKKHGVLEEAYQKVIANEFKNYTFEFTNEDMFLCIEHPESDITEKKQIGYCIALSEAVKIKKRSFPRVKYMIFDEYMLEEKQAISYVNGWKEPDLLLSIYHTIDREEDRVIVFMLGNNTKFHNPYHLHPAFNIPPIEKGGIWTNENVLFQYAIGSSGLKEKKEKSKFLRMLNGTDYGKYAKDGDYVNDNYSFIEKMQTSARYNFTIEYDSNNYGVYSDFRNGVIYISDKVDPSCKLKYALTIDDHKENTLLTHSKNITQLKWLANNYKIGNVRFVSMEVKMKCEKGIALLLWVYYNKYIKIKEEIKNEMVWQWFFQGVRNDRACTG